MAFISYISSSDEAWAVCIVHGICIGFVVIPHSRVAV